MDRLSQHRQTASSRREFCGRISRIRMYTVQNSATHRGVTWRPKSGAPVKIVMLGVGTAATMWCALSTFAAHLRVSGLEDSRLYFATQFITSRRVQAKEHQRHVSTQCNGAGSRCAGTREQRRVEREPEWHACMRASASASARERARKQGSRREIAITGVDWTED